MKRFHWLWIGPAILTFVVWRWLPRGEAPPLGLMSGRLTDCPESPNAVSSFATDARHAIAPLSGPVSFDRLWTHCREAALSEPGARIVEENSAYIHLEITTRWWRFIDDLEFLASPTEGKIHVRSASRIGYSDLGTNRRRVERIRDKLRTIPQGHSGGAPESRGDLDSGVK